MRRPVRVELRNVRVPGEARALREAASPGALRPRARALGRYAPAAARAPAARALRDVRGPRRAHFRFARFLTACLPYM